MKPALATAARVEPKPAVQGLLQISVRMTKDDDLRVSKVLGQLLAVMDHQEADAFDFKPESMRQIFRPFLVIVTPNCVQRGDCLQFLHERLCVDIAA